MSFNGVNTIDWFSSMWKDLECPSLQYNIETGYRYRRHRIYNLEKKKKTHSLPFEVIRPEHPETTLPHTMKVRKLTQTDRELNPEPSGCDVPTTAMPYHPNVSF